MEIVELNSIDTKIPKGVSGIQGDESIVFVKGDKITAGCEASGGNVIILTKNIVNEIIDFQCEAHTIEGNLCGNRNVNSESCVIYSQIKKTT